MNFWKISNQSQFFNFLIGRISILLNNTTPCTRKWIQRSLKNYKRYVQKDNGSKNSRMESLLLNPHSRDQSNNDLTNSSIHCIPKNSACTMIMFLPQSPHQT